jgi:hypothetical protein
MFRRSLIGLALCLALAGGVAAQPQLQELAVTAVAGPGWEVVAQGERVVIRTAMGLCFFSFDSVLQEFSLVNTMQLPHYSKMKFHPSLPYLYLALDAWSGYNLFLIDLTDLENPSFQMLPIIASDCMDDFDVTENGLFVLMDDDWIFTFCVLMTYDNTNPRYPFLIDTSNVARCGNELIIDGDFLHGGGGFGPIGFRYGIYEFGDPFYPNLLLTDIYNWVSAFDAGGGHSAINDETGLYIYETHPYPPYISGPIFYANYSEPLQCTSDGYVYAEGSTGINKLIGNSWSALGIDSVENFYVDGSLLFDNETHNRAEVWSINGVSASKVDSFLYEAKSPDIVDAKNNIAAVTSMFMHNILFYDVTDPSDPVLLNDLNVTTGWSGDICMTDHHLYCLLQGNATDTIAIVDTQNPSNPQIINRITLPSDNLSSNIVTNDSLLFIISQHHIYVYDINDPVIPILAHQQSTPDYLYDQTILDDCLIVGSFNGVTIYGASRVLPNLSSINQSSLSLIGGLNDTLLLSSNYNLHIYSISDPQNPQLLMTTELPGINPKIYYGAFDGTYLYALLNGYPRHDDDRSLTAFDLTPASPNIEMIDYFQIMDHGGGQIILNDGNILIAQLTCLGIYSFTDSTVAPVSPQPKAPPLPSPLTFTPSPNPTNGDLRWEFTLPRSEEVTLEVYNLQGARVGEYQPGRMSPGFHNLSWFPQGLASGVYLAQVRAGNFTAREKVVYLK